MSEEKREEHPLKDLMSMVAGKAEDKASWPVTMFLLAGVVIIFAILGIRMALAKRKAAELAYQLRKVEEEKKQAEENAKLADNANARKTAEDEAKALTKDILGIKAGMVRREHEHKALLKDLSSVTSWDDLVVK